MPAGTVDDPLNLANEALREALEETGLSGLKVVKYLGTQDFDASMFRPEIHERHFFHLQATPPVPEKWLHYEEHPTGGGEPIAYECYWVDIKDAGLFTDQGALLDKIYPPLPPPGSSFDL